MKIGLTSGKMSGTKESNNKSENTNNTTDNKDLKLLDGNTNRISYK